MINSWEGGETVQQELNHEGKRPRKETEKQNPRSKIPVAKYKKQKERRGQIRGASTVSKGTYVEA